MAFDLGEPDLNLVEPGGVSRGEVKADSRMLSEELSDGLSFVGGEIVEDDVNLLPRRAQGYDLLQEGNELTAGMACRGFAVNTAGGGVESGILRRGFRAGSTRSHDVRRVLGREAGRGREGAGARWRAVPR